MSKYGNYTELTTAIADGDLFLIVDVSDTTDDATGSTRRVVASNIKKNLIETAQSVTPNTDDLTGSTIVASANAVDVGAVTTDANDWVRLPSLSTVEVGHTILIACNAGTNFELRTPSASSEKINNVNSDGTAEYLCTDTDTVRIWKLSDTDGWIAQSITNLGAVRTAVVPD